MGFARLIRLGDRHGPGLVAHVAFDWAGPLTDTDEVTGWRTAAERNGARGYRSALLEAGTAMGRLQLAAYALAHGASGITFYDDEVSAFLRTDASPMLVTTVAYPTSGPAPANAPPRSRGYGSSSPEPATVEPDGLPGPIC
jgi:hypothetical protein